MYCTFVQSKCTSLTISFANVMSSRVSGDTIGGTFDEALDCMEGVKNVVSTCAWKNVKSRSEAYEKKKNELNDWDSTKQEIFTFSKCLAPTMRMGYRKKTEDKSLTTESLRLEEF